MLMHAIRETDTLTSYKVPVFANRSANQRFIGLVCTTKQISTNDLR